MFQVIIITKKGQILRFDLEDVRLMKRAGQGIRAIKVAEDDEVVGVEIIEVK